MGSSILTNLSSALCFPHVCPSPSSLAPEGLERRSHRYSTLVARGLSETAGFSQRSTGRKKRGGGGGEVIIIMTHGRPASKFIVGMAVLG